jgi:hypothetical protein
VHDAQHAGGRDRRHVTGKTRAAVVENVRELERRRDSGTLGAASNPTGRRVARALADRHRSTPRTSTHAGEPRIRRPPAPDPGIGRHRLDRLRSEHLDQLYTALLDAGYSPASVLRHHRILSRALTVSVGGSQSLGGAE